ncbi:DNA topoisomerase 2 [Anaeramoeba flamelloides]|uniref:DNA topoisomerase (ATP-hydrolyzing) n=1 Tax=Anaeramoeba flamelloides TaxID=1746091 RepID=A0ABQ8XJ85_9EUKA|nr:DNA topoisomerase 2 [Anaeramoeba flamelloides]
MKGRQQTKKGAQEAGNKELNGFEKLDGLNFAGSQRISSRVCAPHCEGNQKSKKGAKIFTLPEFNEWKMKNNNRKGYYFKYYKGLGTSTTKEAKGIFWKLKVAQLIGYVSEHSVYHHGEESLADLIVGC